MKKLLILISLVTINTQAQYGLRVPTQEHFVVNVHLDYPKTLNPEKKERGLNYNIEAGIQSAISNFLGTEVKVGYEAFPSLYGGYEAFTGSFGIRMVYGYNEEWNYYLGFRASKVFRTSEKLGRTYRWNPGLEIKVSRDITDFAFIGLRYTLDRAYDQQIFDWNVENRWGLYATIGFKLFPL